MVVIRVSNDGLQSLAAQHVAASAEVAGSIPASPVGPPAQSTSAAVASGYEALRTATDVFATRLKTTGSKLSSAGGRYAVQEDSSALRLDGVGSAAGT